MHLLHPSDLESIFSSYFLLNQNSFYVIDPKTKTYQTDMRFTSLVEYANYIKRRYIDGRTIIVKNLENYNEAIKIQSLKYGIEVDVHMYLVPPNGGDSFDFHTDERDVNVFMVYGEKVFEIKRNNEVLKYHIKAGESLFIKKGEEHRASSPAGASCLLSFGTLLREDYFVPGGLDQRDLAVDL